MPVRSFLEYDVFTTSEHGRNPEITQHMMESSFTPPFHALPSLGNMLWNEL